MLNFLNVSESLSQTTTLNKIKKSGVETPVDNVTLKVMIATIAKQDSIIKAADEVIQECAILVKQSEGVILKQKEQITNRQENLEISSSYNTSLKYQVGVLQKENKSLKFKLGVFKVSAIVIPVVGGATYAYFKYVK